MRYGKSYRAARVQARKVDHGPENQALFTHRGPDPAWHRFLSHRRHLAADEAAEMIPEYTDTAAEMIGGCFAVR